MGLKYVEDVCKRATLENGTVSSRCSSGRRCVWSGQHPTKHSLFSSKTQQIFLCQLSFRDYRSGYYPGLYYWFGDAFKCFL